MHESIVIIESRDWASRIMRHGTNRMTWTDQARTIQLLPQAIPPVTMEQYLGAAATNHRIQVQFRVRRTRTRRNLYMANLRSHHEMEVTRGGWRCTQMRCVNNAN